MRVFLVVFVTDIFKELQRIIFHKIMTEICYCLLLLLLLLEHT
jgi:hypothetical protein